MLELQLHWRVGASLPESSCGLQISLNQKLKFEARNLKPSLPFFFFFFVSLCFLLFKSQTRQVSFFIVRHHCSCFFLQRWGTWLCFSPAFFTSYQWRAITLLCCSCSALWDWANLKRLWEHHCVFIRTWLCLILWNLMSGCVLWISDDVILIKYFVYYIIVCVCETHSS